MYLYLSSSSGDHHLSNGCLGIRMRVGTYNKFCHSRASLALVHSASSIVFCCCWCVGGSSTTILPLLVQIIRTFANVTIFVQCVLVNTLQYHHTVDFVQDSETEDPQWSSVLGHHVPTSLPFIAGGGSRGSGWRCQAETEPAAGRHDVIGKFSGSATHWATKQ